MVRSILVTVVAGCGQMYQQPGAAPPPPAPPEALPEAQPAAAPRPGKPPARPAPDAVAQALLDAHNRDRALHCAAPLAWSATLAKAAEAWANTLRDQGCKFGHSGGKYGENLAAGTTGALDAEAVVAMWYDETKQYDFKRGGFSMETGHFTQLVWLGTTQVGCGRAQCKGMDIWVCEYDPPGNWEGQYRENVLPRSCKR